MTQVAARSKHFVQTALVNKTSSARNLSLNVLTAMVRTRQRSTNFPVKVNYLNIRQRSQPVPLRTVRNNYGRILSNLLTDSFITVVN